MIGSPRARITLLLLAAATGCAGAAADDTAPAPGTRYGGPMPTTGSISSLSAAISAAETDGRYEGRIQGRITEVCRKKGCFVILTDGEDFARVTFEDYGFFVPTDLGARPATVQGTLEAVELSAERANHYAEDAGRDGETSAPVREWTMVATSLQLD